MNASRLRPLHVVLKGIAAEDIWLGGFTGMMVVVLLVLFVLVCVNARTLWADYLLRVSHSETSGQIAE